MTSFKKTSNIYKTTRIRSLHNKITDYKDLEFDYDFDPNNKTQTHTLNMIVIMPYLFLDGPLNPNMVIEFVKYIHHKEYITTPTLKNLIRHPKEQLRKY